MKKNCRKKQLSFNAPVILGYFFICLIALVLDGITGGMTNRAFFSVYRSSLLNPLTYVRFFGHVIGHANWAHFFGNMTMLLVVGPLLEEKYGSSNILFVILATALATGLIHFIFFPNVQLLGASGVVFALILLSSLTTPQDEKIPLTFVLVAVIYLGQQIYDGIFVENNISHLAHITGGIVGSALGYVMNKHKMNRY